MSAATTTSQVGSLINKVAGGNVSASSTPDISGVATGATNFFSGINDWLRDKAGIDFFGILKAIGHFFIMLVGFVVDLLKKIL